MRTLAARALRLGPRDPESAAQEAVQRSLAHVAARPALVCFNEGLSLDPVIPAWNLLQLLGWLHGVLRFVVWEEHARASTRREYPGSRRDVFDLADPAPSQLDEAIATQLSDMVQSCLSTLDEDYRATLRLRLNGASYAEIAARLGVNEKTVATSIRRGTLELVRQVRRRMDVGRREPYRTMEEHDG